MLETVEKSEPKNPLQTTCFRRGTFPEAHTLFLQIYICHFFTLFFPSSQFLGFSANFN